LARGANFTCQSNKTAQPQGRWVPPSRLEQLSQTGLLVFVSLIEPVFPGAPHLLHETPTDFAAKLAAGVRTIKKTDAVKLIIIFFIFISILSRSIQKIHNIF
jgi:hypothetical protein